jgi:hypothetical protein
MLTQQERQMQCAPPEVLNESTVLTDDNPFSTHSALAYALVRAPARPHEGAPRVVSP